MPCQIQRVLALATALLLTCSVTACKKEAAESDAFDPTEAIVGTWEADMEAAAEIAVEHFADGDPTVAEQIRTMIRAGSNTIEIRGDGTSTQTVVGGPQGPTHREVKQSGWEVVSSDGNTLIIQTRDEGGETKRREIVFQDRDSMTHRNMEGDGPAMPMHRQR